MSRYLPPLSVLLPVNNLPESLGSVKDGIINIFNNIYFEDLLTNKSFTSNETSYKIKLIAKQRLEVHITGTDGISIVLNPSYVNGDTSEFPIHFSYQWEILKYIRDFDISDFDFSLRSFYDLFLNICGVQQSEILNNLIDTFLRNESDDDPIQTFIDRINSKYSSVLATSITKSSDFDEIIVIEDIINQLSTNGNNIEIIEIIYNDYINFGELETNLELLFARFLGNFTIANLKSLIIPKFKFSLTNFNIALEFPRSLIKPIDPSTGYTYSNVNIKSMLSYNLGSLLFNSEEGLEFIEGGMLTFTQSIIGDTGLQLSITNATIDLNDHKNIAPADLDGRSTAFKGIYVEEGIITLPDTWKQKLGAASNPQLVVEKLLLGTEGGVSGLIKIQGTNPEFSVEFAIADATKITKDSVTDEITILGSGTNKKVIKAVYNDNTYVRDITRKLYQIDIEGNVTVSSVNPSTILNYEFDNGIEIGLDSFSIQFHQNDVIAGSVIGYITIPKFKDSNGNPLIYNISVDFQDGFNIKVFSTQGIPLIDNEFVKFELSGLEIGRQDAIWKFGFAGSIENKITFPAVEDIIPKKIKFNEFLYYSNNDLSFDVEVEWPGGLIVKGTDESGFGTYLPIKKNIGDFASIEGIRIQLASASGETDLIVELEKTGLNLGPVSVEIKGFGMKANIKEASGGAIGPFDLDFDIIPPTGLSINIKSEILKGGGFLVIDNEKGSYMGGLFLSFKKLSLNAIGILNTKMPDGSKGFSLLVIITATFPTPIQLGMGFNLSGVGGLLGVHRSVKKDPLRDGVKSGALNAMLFPTDEDIKKNTVKIIGDIATIFPVQKDHYAFGPMAKIGWSTPSIITLNVGIVLEIPNPTLYLLGVLKAILPTEEKPLVQLQVNFRGILDFKNKELSFYASLYNSKILSMTLTGDMALLMNWSENPMFILTAGGFHPKFKLPSCSLPALNRMTISISDSDDLKVKLESYFAITSNTVQFGAKVFIDAKSGKFFIRGQVGTDVLIQFSPFYFTTALYFSAEAGRNSTVFFTIGVDANLEGPNTWHIWGQAKFEICKVDVSVNFDKIIGEKVNDVQGSIAIVDKLIETIEKKDNWEALISENDQAAVSLVNFEADKLVLHPNGSLSVNQTYLPFGLNMQKFGNSLISDANRISISSVDVNSIAIVSQTKKDFFSTGEYINLTKDEKLSKKSFDLYDSGVLINDSSELNIDGHKLIRELGTPDTIVLTKNILSNSVDKYKYTNAASKIDAGFLQNYISEPGIGNVNVGNHTVSVVSNDTKIEIKDIFKDSFYVGLIENHTNHSAGTFFASAIEAEQHLENLILSNPAYSDTRMVLSNL